jgi:copper chaperone CopZ
MCLFFSNVFVVPAGLKHFKQCLDPCISMLRASQRALLRNGASSIPASRASSCVWRHLACTSQHPWQQAPLCAPRLVPMQPSLWCYHAVATDTFAEAPQAPAGVAQGLATLPDCLFHGAACLTWGGARAGAQQPLTVVLDVQGMKCGGCSAAVKRMLQQQPGVQAAAVNLLTETAAVQAAPGESAAQLGEACAALLTKKVAGMSCVGAVVFERGPRVLYKAGNSL